jgi:hypothetical protein
MKLIELKNGGTLNAPIYKVMPYVILAPQDKSNSGMVLSAGTLDDMLKQSSYYDNCVVDIRKYDLFMNDNTKI